MLVTGFDGTYSREERKRDGEEASPQQQGGRGVGSLVGPIRLQLGDNNPHRLEAQRNDVNQPIQSPGDSMSETLNPRRLYLAFREPAGCLAEAATVVGLAYFAHS